MISYLDKHHKVRFMFLVSISKQYILRLLGKIICVSGKQIQYGSGHTLLKYAAGSHPVDVSLIRLFLK